MSGDRSRGGGRLDALMLAVSALAPACLAAAHAAAVADVAHDRAVARALGVDAQAWRALDAGVAGLFSAVPLGTQSARAAAGVALVAGVAGAALFALTRALLGGESRAPSARPNAGAGPSWMRPLVAAVASLAATLAPPWQAESACAGASAVGALLVLAPVVFVGARARVEGGRSWLLAALAVGLAAGYEPLVGACALLGCG